MRVLVAGVTGVLGVPLVRRLIAEGHVVTGLCRTHRRTSTVEALGVRAVVADALDGSAVRSAVVGARPHAIVHALTALPPRGPLRAADLDATNALRVTGTRNLLAAAVAAGTRRLVVESMVFVYGFGDLGDAPLTEDGPTARRVPKRWLQPSIDALVSEETQVHDATSAGHIDGVVLRFGGFYGPGTGFDTMVEMLRRRALPFVSHARSRGVPWIHIDDAVSAVVAALQHGQPGSTYNIVDDRPAPAGELIRHLAREVGAPQPWSVPGWVVRLSAPFVATAWLDTTLIVSNAKAKRELGWVPQFPTYREGIVQPLGLRQ
jgi:nucleoside-diphosphate-sugar epimerase